MNSHKQKADTLAEVIRRKLEEAQDTLIERNLRNKLVSCGLRSGRLRQIRVVDEVCDEVFRALLGQEREFVFAAGRGVPDESQESGENDLATWVPPDDDAFDRRHRDNVLQTQLTPEGLEKRLTFLYYQSREVEEEQGVNVLYLALGFLKWFESGTSEIERFAPLILLPVELTRDGARDRFKLKSRDEDLFTNVSLRAWLSEQHSIQLPELPTSDEWTPSEYFAQVKEAVAKSSRWEVLGDEILLAFFSFNKFLLWRDLDPKNWPSSEALLGHKVLRSLLAPSKETLMLEAPVIPEDARIDDIVPLSRLTYVLDADSSQTSAIQTAVAGRNLVIQGPPGTGKSQTIANIIASAIVKGKSVLFVAEKMAALDVVFSRLKSVGLGHLCFELHSRKASKKQVLAQLREAIEALNPPKVPSDLGASLDSCASTLWKHSDRLHKPMGTARYTPFEVIGRICRLKDQKVASPDFQVAESCMVTRNAIDDLLQDCVSLARQLQTSGIPARHPWRDCGRDTLNPIDQQRLGNHVRKLEESIQALESSMANVWPLVRVSPSDDFLDFPMASIELVRQALNLARVRPDFPTQVLCDPRWASDVAEIEELASTAKRVSFLHAKAARVFLASAWEDDWKGVRLELARSGRSLLRIFRREYRDAMRVYRAHSRAMPSKLEERLQALDGLIEGISQRQVLEQQATSLRDDMSWLPNDLPAEWKRLEALAVWLKRANALGSTVSIRNEKLLEWSEDHAEWASKLKLGMDSLWEALAILAGAVQLNDTRISIEEHRIGLTFGELRSRTSDWQLGIERYNEWPPVRDGVAKLGRATSNEFAGRCYSGDVVPDQIAGQVELAVFEQLWNSMTAEEPALSRIDGRSLDDTLRKFRELDRQRINAAAHEVARTHNAHKPTGTIGDMGVIRTELNKSRRHWPVRKLIDVAGHGIQQLKPAFLMSPLSVAQYLPPGRIEFDLLLIDEASQVRPSDALGAVVRSNQVVAVGDSKQLPPTNFFNRLVNDDDGNSITGQWDDSLDMTAPLGAMESILSLCDSSFPNPAMLSWHYRSRHPGLIAVSNRNFYDNKLLLPPSVLSGKVGEGLGVVFHQTPPGGYDRGGSATNVIEADKVAEAVCDFARQSPKRSLGVGTFSVAQRDAIRARVDARRRESPDLEPFFSTNRTEPFFVKNLESIQGDERDVIFVSVAYGRDRDGRLTQNFGPINSEGGERRLNVLISRARERCEVFSPITADDIDVSNRKLGTVALREFLQYAHKGYFDVAQPTNRTFDSDFEESVGEFLRSRGLVVHPQVGMAGFYIDLGVIDSRKPGRYVIGVECDGATYHSSRSARDRDRLRQEILEARGWTIHRIWSTDWFHRRSNEEARLLDAIERAAATTQPIQRPPDAHASGHSMTSGMDAVPTATERPTTPYVEASFRVGSRQAPHEASDATVDGAMLRILQVESPIHEEEACRRLATVWGLDRAGSRIRDAGLSSLHRLARRGSCVDEDGFWMLKAEPIVVRDRSATTSITLRRAEYLPPLEIVKAATDVLDESARVHLDDLVVEVARRFGFQRTGVELQQSIRSAIEMAVGSHFMRDPGDLLRNQEKPEA